MANHAGRLRWELGRKGPASRLTGSRWERLTAVPFAAVVAWSLSACGEIRHAPRPADNSLLPRQAVLPLGAVKAVLPEIAREIATGRDATAVGRPTATRSVTFATGDGSRRVVLTVDLYPRPAVAAAAFEEAVRKSREVPGFQGGAAPIVGERSFAGVVTQGKETHVGSGALVGDRVAGATLQGYAGTRENQTRATELLRRQTAAMRVP